MSQPKTTDATSPPCPGTHAEILTCKTWIDLVRAAYAEMFDAWEAATACEHLRDVKTPENLTWLDAAATLEEKFYSYAALLDQEEHYEAVVDREDFKPMRCALRAAANSYRAAAELLGADEPRTPRALEDFPDFGADLRPADDRINDLERLIKRALAWHDRHEQGEARQPRPAPTATAAPTDPSGTGTAAEVNAQRMSALLDGEGNAKILKIAEDPKMSVSDRQAAIYALDKRVLCWTGVRWGRLLDCTDRAARKAYWFRIDRPRLMRAVRDFGE
jgi:hypothetical protein